MTSGSEADRNFGMTVAELDRARRRINPEPSPASALPVSFRLRGQFPTVDGR